MKQFKSINEVAKHLLKEQGIKVKTEYVADFNYDANWIYLPRVYSYDVFKAKVRVLQNGIDTVKNCIKITYDVDVFSRAEIVAKVNNIKHLIPYHINGTCQTFLTVRILEQLLVCYERNNSVKQEVKQLLKA